MVLLVPMELEEEPQSIEMLTAVAVVAAEVQGTEPVETVAQGL